MFESVSAAAVLALLAPIMPRHFQPTRRQQVLRVRNSVADKRKPFNMKEPSECAIGHARMLGIKLVPKCSASFYAIFGATNADRAQTVSMLEWLADQPESVTAAEINRKWQELGVLPVYRAPHVSGVVHDLVLLAGLGADVCSSLGVRSKDR